jgi:hypothetical protein
MLGLWKNLKTTDKRWHGAVCNTEAHHINSCPVCSQVDYDVKNKKKIHDQFKALQ